MKPVYCANFGTDWLKKPRKTIYISKIIFLYRNIPKLAEINYSDLYMYMQGKYFWCHLSQHKRLYHIVRLLFPQIYITKHLLSLCCYLYIHICPKDM